jgi:hypothetical protein
MPKRKQQPSPVDEVSIPSGIEDVLPMVGEAWDLFKEFQRSSAGVTAGIPQTIARVGRLIEQDEEACISIFGAGFTSGMQLMMSAIQDAHLRLHLVEMLDDLPITKRPRA